jgi:pimeloyl-ACP methyl ester carboxylesterase
MRDGLRTLRQGSGAPDLLVLLPGAYMTPDHFADNGFFAAVDRRRLALDLVAVDLDLEAISSGSALATVHREILAPARIDYARVWLGGISLGGLLALYQAADAPASIDGLCLLAPYPGSRLTTNAIASAGGLDRWHPAAGNLDDPEFRVWDWLRQPPAGLPAFVGYGSDDRFAAGMAAIAGRFPPAARCALPGGHDWPVWRALWEHFLALGHFAGRADAGEPGGA